MGYGKEWDYMYIQTKSTLAKLGEDRHSPMFGDLYAADNNQKRTVSETVMFVMVTVSHDIYYS